MVAQITSPHFTAGLVFENGKVALSAPILRYMEGWSKQRVEEYAIKMKWVVNFDIKEIELP